MDQHVLLRQAWIRDETLTISQVLAQAAASIGENIIIGRFMRWEMDQESMQK